MAKFQVSDKPRGYIEEVSEGYYVLHLGERELGGTSKDRLERYARKEGWIVDKSKYKPMKGLIELGWFDPFK